MGKNYTGVQCKKKDIWPPKELTTDEIDQEVEKAKTWKPGLKHFIIATTASNDEKVQAHARAITKAHKKKRLFTVMVASWSEITRRLARYPEVLRTYGYLQDLSQLSQQVSTAIADETSKRVLQALSSAKVEPRNTPLRSTLNRMQVWSRHWSATWPLVTTALCGGRSSLKPWPLMSMSALPISPANAHM